MPKSGVDGPSYAGHVNVNPHGSEPEWVLEQDAPAPAVVVEVEPPAVKTPEPVEAKPATKADDKPAPARRSRR